MFGINKIEISINSLDKNIFIEIFPNNEEIIFNNKKIKVMKEFLERLIRIIRTWKPLYENSNVLDGEKFFIKVFSNNKVDEIVGNGSLPENYMELKNWIGDIDGNRV